jgi:hypothetical protein
MRKMSVALVRMKSWMTAGLFISEEIAVAERVLQRVMLR